MTVVFPTAVRWAPGGHWKALTHILGKTNEISEEPELKVKVTIKAENLQKTISAIKAVHPYEEPVINAIPLLVVGC